MGKRTSQIVTGDSGKNGSGIQVAHANKKSRGYQTVSSVAACSFLLRSMIRRIACRNERLCDATRLSSGSPDSCCDARRIGKSNVRAYIRLF